MLCRCLVVSVSVALLAPGAAAQLTAAQATKQLKGALAQELGDLKASLNVARVEFFVALAAFEAELKAGTYTTGDVEDLFDALQDMMGSIGSSVRATGNDISIAAGAALAGFADGAVLNGIFPAGFYPGNGTPIDNFHAAVLKAQEKTIAAVAKRLAKTRKLAEKAANVGFTVVLSAPAAVREHTFKEGGGVSLSNETHITVDALIAVSDLAQASDGVVFVGGSGSPGLGAVFVVLLGSDDFTESGGVPTSVAHRWGLAFDDGGSGVAEGVWIGSASQGLGGSLATASIGVR